MQVVGMGVVVVVVWWEEEEVLVVVVVVGGTLADTTVHRDALNAP